MIVRSHSSNWTCRAVAALFLPALLGSASAQTINLPEFNGTARMLFKAIEQQPFVEVESTARIFTARKNDSPILSTEYVSTARVKHCKAPFVVDFHPCKMAWKNGAAPYIEEFRTLVVGNKGCYNMTHAYSSKGEKTQYGRAEIWALPPSDIAVNPLATGQACALGGILLFSKVPFMNILEQCIEGQKLGAYLKNGEELNLPMEMLVSKTANGLTLTFNTEDKGKTEILELSEVQNSIFLSKRTQLTYDKNHKAINEQVIRVLENQRLPGGGSYPTKAELVEKAGSELRRTAVYEAKVKEIAGSVVTEGAPPIPPGYSVKDHRIGAHFMSGDTASSLLERLKESLGRLKK